MAFGESYMRAGVEDVVFCYLRFPSGLAAHLHLSWLDPHKERRFTASGPKSTCTFSATAITRQVTLRDNGFSQDLSPSTERTTRAGGIWRPEHPTDEAQTQHDGT